MSTRLQKGSNGLAKKWIHAKAAKWTSDFVGLGKVRNGVDRGAQGILGAVPPKSHSTVGGNTKASSMELPAQLPEKSFPTQQVFALYLIWKRSL